MTQELSSNGFHNHPNHRGTRLSAGTLTTTTTTAMLQLFLLVFLSMFYLLSCPYTKVEESFNLQAMHDLLFHKTRLDLFDHLEFPGVVPRTFVGPLFVTFWVAPIASFLDLLGCGKDVAQVLVRGQLGLCVVYVFTLFRVGVGVKFGKSVAFWLSVLTLTQFHLAFYLTRPLPNIFALIPLLLALHSWLVGNLKHFIWQAAFSVIVFRSELVVFVGLIAFWEVFVSQKLKLKDLILQGAAAGCLSLVATVGVDSLFWKRLCWPEGEVFFFNAILNKSSEWGTSPFLWYFYSALPRALGPCVFLLPLGVFLDFRLFKVLFPALGFVLAFSLLPHKELRFVIYVLPLLNIPIARAADYLWTNRKKSFRRHIASVVLLACLGGNLALSALSFWASYYNYPGGAALKHLHSLEDPESGGVSVHLDWNVAQTGASRFLELSSVWKYSKEEDLEPGGARTLDFTHLLLGVDASTGAFDLSPYHHTHSVVKVVPGFARYRIEWNHFPPFQLMLEPKVAILKRIVQSSVVINASSVHT